MNRRMRSFIVPDKPLDRKSPESKFIVLDYANYFGLVNIHKDGYHIRFSDGFLDKIIEYSVDHLKAPHDIDQADMAWAITKFVTETIADMPICISLKMLVKSDRENKLWFDICDLMLTIHRAYYKLPPSDESTSDIKNKGEK